MSIIQPETKKALEVLKPGTVAAESMAIGRIHREPIFYALDGMLRYAKAYQACFESPISKDGFAADYFLDTIKGLRGLLNMDGAVAWELGRSTDSKDNGVCEEIFWQAMKAGGFTEEDL